MKTDAERESRERLAYGFHFMLKYTNVFPSRDQQTQMLLRFWGCFGKRTEGLSPSGSISKIWVRVAPAGWRANIRRFPSGSHEKSELTSFASQRTRSFGSPPVVWTIPTSRAPLARCPLKQIRLESG